MCIFIYSDSNDWHETVSGNTLCLSRLQYSPESNSAAPPTFISHSLLIDERGIAKLHVAGLPVDLKACPALTLSEISSDSVNYSNFPSFIDLLESLAICPGNPESMFVDVVQKKKKKCFVSRGGIPSLKVVAWPNLVSGSFCSTTVRSRKCEILTTSGQRCQPCQQTRAQLRVYYKRSQTPSSPLTASKFAKNSSLSTPQRSGKFAQLARKAKFQQRKITRTPNIEPLQCWGQRNSHVTPELRIPLLFNLWFYKRLWAFTW